MMIVKIVIFEFLLESSTSNWSISFVKVVASVAIGCKPSKISISDNHLGNFVDLARKVLFLLIRLSLKLTNS